MLREQGHSKLLKREKIYMPTTKNTNFYVNRLVFLDKFNKDDFFYKHVEKHGSSSFNFLI
jgi:hypothetical protein